jgi:hypothetical protein
MNSTIRVIFSIFLILSIIITCIPQGICVKSSITIQQPCADTWVNSMYLHTKFPEKPHGYLWALFAGNMYDNYYDLFGSSRIYLRFNLSAITQEYQIISAVLKLYMYDGPSSPQKFDIHVVNSDWDENVVIWVIQPDFCEGPIASTIIDSTASRWISWNVTKAAKDWHSNKSSNHGLMIKINKEMNATDEVASFRPKEISLNKTDIEFAPKLEIIVEGDTEIPEISLYILPLYLVFAIFFVHRIIRRSDKNNISNF